MQVLLGKHWHHLPVEEVVQLLETDLERGLDLFDVKHRQEHFGPNILTPQRRKSPLRRFLLQFNNPLIYILLVSSVITAIVKDWVDAVIIFAVVLVNAVIGFVQESKAEQAIEALAQTMTAEATVLRAGKTQRVSAAELVPGDVVSLRAGDKVPSDLRLVRSRDLQVAEAALTGESVPVDKSAGLSLPPDTVLAERRNVAYASTLVTYGIGTGVVTATGDNSEVGRIAQLISSAEALSTPLTRKIDQFSHVVLYAILALAALTFLVGILRGQPAIDTFTAAIALAVAMIPEGLPAALTVTLAIGVSRMAHRRAVIRRLPAVEALGSTTVICSDKTGTLTQNQMTVQQIGVLDACYEVTGVGYNPAGQIAGPNGQLAALDRSPALREVLMAGYLCNDAQLQERDGTWTVQGDPTEMALLVAARKGGLSPEDTEYGPLPRLDTIPFESQHQYMATLHDLGPDRPRVMYVKGAAEVLLDRCGGALDALGASTPCRTDELHHMANVMAGRGLRVLALARKDLPPGTTAITHDDVALDLTLLGLQGMIDPPRPEAVAAVRACRQAGICVKMITGDHPLTARAIAEQLGLVGLAAGGAESPTVLTGHDLAGYSDEALIEAAQHVSVFARVSPEQKLRLVEALQARSQIVAMTGDGVNDGPALKQSDIGIAMGITGTDVAKEAADVVLTDDNFATIEAAVEEGRGVFDNLTKLIAWMLPTNLGEGLIILLAILLGAVLPILPVHILWINLTTAAVLGLVLAVEPKEPHIMRRPPRDPKAPILTPTLLWRVGLVGLLILSGAFGLFELELAAGASPAQARTVAVNAVIVIEILYLFNCRSLTQSIFRIGILTNRWVVAGVAGMVLLQLGFTYLPFMNRFLSSAPISLTSWAEILAVGIVSYLVVELEKWARRRRPPVPAEEAVCGQVS